MRDALPVAEVATTRVPMTAPLAAQLDDTYVKVNDADQQGGAASATGNGSIAIGAGSITTQNASTAIGWATIAEASDAIQ